MNADKLILLVINHASGTIKGKTLLQKRIYFITKMLSKDLGYRAHYYGPYSPKVEEGLAKLKALGFVEERNIGFGMTDNVGFEMRRYDYVLTDDGITVLNTFKKNETEECAKIESVLNDLVKAGDKGDYMKLSIAAKTYHILLQESTPMDAPTIHKAAKKLGWDISEQSINEAATFLEGLDLAQRQ